MGVDPAQDHQVLEAVYVVEQVGFVRHLAGIARGGLSREDEFGHEEGIGEEGAGQEGAGFEVAFRIWVSEGEEGMA